MKDLKINVNDKAGLKKEIRISVPFSAIEEKRTSRFIQIAKTAKLPGFRPGKVPDKVIHQQYGGKVIQEVLSDFLDSTYIESIREKNLKPAGPPEVKIDEYIEGKDFTYTATIEVYPEFELRGLDKISVEKPKVEISQKEINAMIENLQKQRGTWNPVERPSEKEDQLIVDFEGKIDGEVFEGGVAQDFVMTLGNGQMLPEFDDALLNVKANEDKEIQLTFPDNYHKEELAKKKAVFSVSVKEVKALEVAEIDETFVRSFGVESGDAKDLIDEVKASMEKELEAKINDEIKKNLMTYLRENNSIEIPEVMVHQEAHALQKDWMSQAGIEKAEEAPELKNFENIAKERVQLGLLVNELVRVQEIKVDQDRVKTKLEEITNRYPNPEEIRKMYEETPQLMDQIKSAVIEDLVIEWLIERTDFQDKAVEFKELMNRS
ncbi:MAG: trigger factor [Gammaproteobacteria bacterium]|nr:MAG: trigger factor [Gammaproteobacteria bacterium]